MQRLSCVLLLALVLLQGCAWAVLNKGLPKWSPADEAALTKEMSGGSEELLVMLAFSGGGTRASAFACGVLQELAETKVEVDGRERRFLDEVDVISSVSGGSFTSAYYGLYGDEIFDGYEEKFLRKNVEGSLIASLFWPPNWFRLGSGAYGQSDLAARYYDEELFHEATFADLERPGTPFILINVTDLATGSRFGFTREFFDALCSDLPAYSVAEAVAASSAVPILLSPITLKNYEPACGYKEPTWMTAALQDNTNARRRAEAKVRASYLDSKLRRYVHLVDGGISDNLGLRGALELMTLAGSAEAGLAEMGHPNPGWIVVLLVDAETHPEPTFALTAASPTMAELVGSVASAQIDHYNFETIELVQARLGEWTRERSKPGRPVEFVFVEVSFDRVADDQRRAMLNEIGTNFDLSGEEVDTLLETSREVLRSSPEFQRLLSSIADKR
ncbi:MAG: patatin-like phospholipase family protein [Candidatus Binatia bacterium]|nr:patatin-like phospholipase family protein [Candidatus Binatia bacterium]